MVLLNAFLIRYDLDITYCLAEVFAEKDVVNLGSVVTRAVCDEVRVPFLNQVLPTRRSLVKQTPGSSHSQHFGRQNPAHRGLHRSHQCQHQHDRSSPQRYKYLRSRNPGDSALQLTVESLLFNFRQSKLRSIDGKKVERRPANEKLQLDISVGDTLDFEYLIHPTLSQQYPNSTQS